jgi:IMP cyclohydrolase
MDMRQFVDKKPETKPKERKSYYEIKARVVVHGKHIDVTAITDLERGLPVFPVRIYVLSHDHDSYAHERIWHLYNGRYKIVKILRDRVIVREIEVKDGEARVIREYTTD